MRDDHSRWRTIFGRSLPMSIRPICHWIRSFASPPPASSPRVSLWSFETGEELTGEIGGVILAFQSRHRHRGRLVSIISTDYLREFAGRREIRRERRPKLGTTLSR